MDFGDINCTGRLAIQKASSLPTDYRVGLDRGRLIQVFGSPDNLFMGIGSSDNIGGATDGNEWRRINGIGTPLIYVIYSEITTVYALGGSDFTDPSTIMDTFTITNNTYYPKTVTAIFTGRIGLANVSATYVDWSTHGYNLALYNETTSSEMRVFGAMRLISEARSDSMHLYIPANTSYTFSLRGTKTDPDTTVVGNFSFTVFGLR